MVTNVPRREAPVRREGVYNLKGKRLASVTEVAGGLAKPHLLKWGAKVAVQAVFDDPHRYDTLEEAVGAIDAVVKAAAMRGRAVHSLVEAWARGQEVPDPEDEALQGYWRAWLSFVQSWKPVARFAEAVVVNWTHGYAGRMDLGATMGTEEWVIDAKTAKAVYPEYPLQLKAYFNAEEMSLDGGLTFQPMPKFDKMGIVLLDAKGTFNLTQVNGDFEAFLHLLKLWEWKKENVAW